MTSINLLMLRSFHRAFHVYDIPLYRIAFVAERIHRSRYLCPYETCRRDLAAFGDVQSHLRDDHAERRFIFVLPAQTNDAHVQKTIDHVYFFYEIRYSTDSAARLVCRHRSDSEPIPCRDHVLHFTDLYEHAKHKHASESSHVLLVPSPGNIMNILQRNTGAYMYRGKLVHEEIKAAISTTHLPASGVLRYIRRHRW